MGGGIQEDAEEVPQLSWRANRIGLKHQSSVHDHVTADCVVEFPECALQRLRNVVKINKKWAVVTGVHLLRHFGINDLMTL